MLYNVASSFIKIDETQGIIQNASSGNSIEVSDTGVADSGIILKPGESLSFSDTDIYVRTIGNKPSAVRVVPFVQGFTASSTSGSSVADDLAADYTSILITSTTPEGKTHQEIVSYVNPNKTKKELAEFGQIIIGSTVNTYISTHRIDKILCDEQEDEPQDDKSKYLIVDLPFAQDFNDNCGGTWSTVGSPTIGDNALQLNGSSYIVKSGGITLGGRDFTVSYGAFADSAQAMQPVFSFTVNENSNGTYRIFSYLRHGSSGKLHAGLCGDSSTATSFDQDYRGQLHNFLHVYDHSNCTFATYVDGVLVATQTNIAIAQTNYPYCRIATAPSLSETKFKGYITEFKVYDGVALVPG